MNASQREKLQLNTHCYAKGVPSLENDVGSGPDGYD